MNLDELWFTMLLPFCLCLETEELALETIRRGTNNSSLCTTPLLRKITWLICNIRTNRTTIEDSCYLQFDPEMSSGAQCGERFTLKTENRRVFLLKNSTPEHSGHYLCECSYFNITTEEEANFSPLTVISCMMAISVVAGVTITAGVLFGLTLRKKHNRCLRQSSGPKLDNKPEDSYTSLQQPAGDLYLTAAPVNHVYVDSMGTSSVGKYKKGCLTSEEQPEDIYENI
ncbi:uncharacterized protein LOC119792305 [Cyprinodon tularosa]|uniref:uncharacterized protein LOC119792305 n=1 Tax=Cyprinodon tularosa TaxID=77115 RepID=UPI0018E25721|nr:uncharacterized protein LOC119792305 [Cyprinodon tularosa]